jgi:transcriptional regulator with XRE-family HTH domain
VWRIKSKALREHRLEKMWSVEQLEKASGVSARTIFALEKEDRAVRVQTLSDLSQAFKVTPRDLATLVDDGPKKKSPSAPPARTDAPSLPAPPAPPAAPPPAPLLRSYGPGVTELPRLTRLEELVAIEATLPPRPPVTTRSGPVPPLTAKLYQDVFTAYRVHEGRVAHLTGVVLSQRGMGDAQAALCGTKSGTGARFHFVFEVCPGHEIGVTVHTSDAGHTAALQERLNQTATVLVKVVVAPDEAYARGAGFEFFMSNTKTLRPWGLEVVEALAPPVAPR